MRGGWFAGGVYERAAVGGLRASRLPPHTVRGLVVYLGMCVCVHVLYIYIYIYIYIHPPANNVCVSPVHNGRKHLASSALRRCLQLVRQMGQNDWIGDICMHIR
jgi:hypothetical protein